MNTKPIILVVDDDRAVRESMRALLESAGYRVNYYASAKIFLQSEIPAGDCLIADIRMPEMDGLELQEVLAKRGSGLPVIIMTGHGDVPLAVRAIKGGAIDFIEKPFDDEKLLESVRKALLFGKHTSSSRGEMVAAQTLIALLTLREKDVLDQLVTGRSNKIVGHQLGISPRTVETHRAHIMDKMHVRSVADLVRIAQDALRARVTHS